MRGQGTLFLRGGVYWAQYYLRGERFRESTGETNPDKAAKFLRDRLFKLEADKRGLQPFTTPKANRLTVGDLVAELKKDFELRGIASAQNLSVLGMVDAAFGDRLAVALKPVDVDAYIEELLDDDFAPATINRRTQLLGQCYQLAIKRGTLSRAPYIRHLSEAGNARKGFFSEAELAGVVSHLPADLHDFVNFAAATGMRKSEIASLTWDDLQGEVLTLQGEHAKNGEARNIPVAGEIAQILTAQDGADVRSERHKAVVLSDFPSQGRARARVPQVMGNRVQSGELPRQTLP